MKKDPRKKHKRPPYSEKAQRPPGSDADMRPQADHGEKSYKGNGRLRNKVALITGGDSGIGRAVVIAYAREGANIMISYLPEEEKDAHETAKWVKKARRKCLCYPGDITRESVAQNLVEKCIQELGQLDILVNNAAFQRLHDSIEDFTPDEVDKTFQTNIIAPFNLCRTALPQMKTGGTIINTASIQAYKPSPQLLAYATTKGAVVTFTKALSEMAIEAGIRVNAVAPGPIWTPLIPSTFPGKREIASFGKDTPMGRAGQPAELAGVFVFLASADSSYITGEIIGVTGGKPIS